MFLLKNKDFLNQSYLREKGLSFLTTSVLISPSSIASCFSVCTVYCLNDKLFYQVLYMPHYLNAYNVNK